MEARIEQLSKELEKERRKNVIIRQISLELGRIGSIESKVSFLLELLETDFGLNHSMLLMPDNTGTFLTVLASRGFEAMGKGAKVNFGDGVIGIVAKNKKKLRIPRLSFLRTYAKASQPSEIPDGKVELPGLRDAESQVAIPLLANNELVAVLSVESADLNFFSQEDEDFLILLSQQMALLIQNTIIYSSLEDKIVHRTAKIDSQKQELEKLNTTKDKLFSIIGHDLRSPVASLQDISELISYYRDKQDYEKLIDLSFKISNTARSLGHLLDNLLSWSLNQKGELLCTQELLHLRNITEEAFLVLKDHAESKAITIYIEVPEGITIFADKEMSVLVVRNVLSNAIKYSYPNGPIFITAESCVDKVILTIHDSGTGINEGKLSDLFSLNGKKSTLGTAREKGTGLGLFLVKEFLEINQGSLKITSETGRGTRVDLYFLPSMA